MTLQLKGGRLLCTATGVDQLGDLWVHQGRICRSAPHGVEAQVIDCVGQVVTPALVDLDARLCDPGFTWRESLRTGGDAALRGGFTTVVANPECKGAHLMVKRKPKKRKPMVEDNQGARTCLDVM